MTPDKFQHFLDEEKKKLDLWIIQRHEKTKEKIRAVIADYRSKEIILDEYNLDHFTELIERDKEDKKKELKTKQNEAIKRMETHAGMALHEQLEEEKVLGQIITLLEERLNCYNVRIDAYKASNPDAFGQNVNFQSQQASGKDPQDSQKSTDNQ